jgi:Domain of unknown function (DUF4394)
MRPTRSIQVALAVLAAGVATSVAIAGSQAATIAALQDGTSIAWIDTDQKKVTKTVTLDGGAKLVGIDVRPADGKLYGVTPDGVIVTIDVASGNWEKKSQISEKLPTGVTFSVDFNPVADRMRVLTSNGMSLRINVEDGKATVDGQLKYADADVNKGKTPQVIAAGYSNSFAGTKETALYDIDVANGVLVKQAPPNDGILNTIGKLNVTLSAPIAFDVWSDGKGANSGWLLNNGQLFSVDLTSGAATSLGAVTGLKGKVSDIAILPAM